jgi:hypothetical protein
MALEASGFRPFGMDPLPAHADSLKELGFEVARGSVESYPENWPEPRAVIMLESLVRFPAPKDLLTDIKRRFPAALLCLSVPSPRRSLKVPEFDRRLDYPPDHLTRWTRPALEHLLERAGYEGDTWICHVNMNWGQGSMKKRLLRFSCAAVLRVLGEFDYSICATGLPKPKRS